MGETKGKREAAEALRSKLSEVGASYTRQRAAVYDYLRGAGTHPTAEEVFLGVKGALPRISLATVYKNLESLVACGMASKLSGGEGAARYDIRTGHHYHSRCVKCGGIADLEPAAAGELRRLLRAPAGFKVENYRIELLGHCKNCQ
ncbi:MAG: Fur family transcriptional regulator [Blastocatellia bacterium]